MTDNISLVWQIFQLKIVNVNRAPTAIISSPDQNNKFTTNDNIYFDATGSYDLDNDTLTYNWASNIQGLLSSAKSFSTKLSAGTHTITLTVSDGVASDSKQITIVVESSIPQPGWKFILTDVAVVVSAICAVIAAIMILRKLKKGR